MKTLTLLISLLLTGGCAHVPASSAAQGNTSADQSGPANNTVQVPHRNPKMDGPPGE